MGTFGVEWRNGLIQPWYDIRLPALTQIYGTPDGDPPCLCSTGGFGIFVGLTPEALVVVGKVWMEVNLDSPTNGWIRFSDLKYDENDNPFGNGTLDHRLAIFDGLFGSVDGDNGGVEGELFEGAIFGTSQPGVFAGVLEIEGVLRGAFGGSFTVRH